VRRSRVVCSLRTREHESFRIRRRSFRDTGIFSSCADISRNYRITGAASSKLGPARGAFTLGVFRGAKVADATRDALNLRSRLALPSFRSRHYFLSYIVIVTDAIVCVFPGELSTSAMSQPVRKRGALHIGRERCRVVWPFARINCA